MAGNLPLRKYFPILNRKINDHDLIYLDNAASAQKPLSVTRAMENFAHQHYANVHRGLHTLANEATQAYENARSQTQLFLNAKHASEIIFTSGGTDAINLVSAGMAPDIQAGDEIILSILEHHANIVPWHFLRQRHGAVLKWVEPDSNGQLNAQTIQQALSTRTKLVAITHMSNVLGCMPDVAAIAHATHQAGARLLVDGCQAAAHLNIDVQQLNADYYVLTAHKLYGPTGIGVLYGKAECLEQLSPWRGGGEMIQTVTREHISYQAPPHKFEAGTPPILEAVGLAAALDFIASLDREQTLQQEQTLRQKAVSGLTQMGFRVFGHTDNTGPIVSFAKKGLHPHDLSQILDQYGIAIRAGHHCAQPLMEWLGVSSTARISFAAYNTTAEIDSFLNSLDKARTMLER